MAKSCREAHENGGQTVSEDRKRLSQVPKGTTGVAITICNFDIELILVATMVEQYKHHMMLLNSISGHLQFKGVLQSFNCTELDFSCLVSM